MGGRVSCLPIGDTGPLRPANMQLVQSRGADLPPGSIVLGDSEVVRLMHKAVLDWKPKSEMWPLLYGTGVLAGGAAATGLYSNHIFRVALKLSNRGRIMSYAAAVVIPTMLSAVVNQAFVVSPLLIGYRSCAVCTEVRSISLQLALGYAQPLALGALACSALSRTYKTFPMPSVTKDLRKVLGIYGRVLNKGGPVLMFLLGSNVMAATVITYYQAESALKVHKHLREAAGGQKDSQ